jgi:WD40 repeat protein
MHVLLCLIALGAAPPTGGVLLPGKMLAISGHTAESIGFSHDGKLIAVGTAPVRRSEKGGPKASGTGQIILCDAVTGEKRRTLTAGPWGVRGVAFGPGSRVVSLDADGAWAVWDAEKGTKSASGTGMHLGKDGSFRLSRDGRTLRIVRQTLRISSPGPVVLVDLKAGSSRDVGMVHGSLPVALGDGGMYAVSNNQDVDIHDLQTGKLLRSILDNPGMMELAEFGPGEKLLAAACMTEGRDGMFHSQIRVFDPRAGKFIRAFPLGRMMPLRLALTPDGRALYVSGYRTDEECIESILFSLTDGGELARVRPKPVFGSRAVAISPDSRTLAMRVTGGVRLYSIRLP